MEQRHIEEAASWPALGPNYFAAREAVEKFMAKFQAEQFEPLIKKAADEFYEKLLSDVQDYLLSNAADNLQGELWRGTDDSVKALLTGEKWALERYALTERYDGAKIRQAVAQHIPAELQDARIKDLEAEIATLRDDLARERHRNR